MSTLIDRTKPIRQAYTGKGPILYWMNRELRVDDNWSMICAETLAEKYEKNLIVGYNLDLHFLGGGRRQVEWKLSSLKQVQQQLSAEGYTFIVFLGSEITPLTDFVNTHDCMACVTDFFPLHKPEKWNDDYLKNTKAGLYIVDSHNIVPCSIASGKQEFGAYTIRPKIHKVVAHYCREFPERKIQAKHTEKLKPLDNVIIFSPDSESEILWKNLEKKITTDETITPITWLEAGPVGAMKTLEKFLGETLSDYEKRNDPNAHALSNLSPYLHYGNISAQRIVLELMKHSGKSWTDILTKKSDEETDVASGFFEELVVRRELADNFCHYNPHYDSPLGYPDWAKKSLEKHREDKREYIYTQREFEKANTHDPLWNAAQNEMRKTGKMHGYMRMYWCKKILEWTPDVETAHQIAIYLNDRYELDGRDPNGYTGIAWSLGGVHDRAWIDRPTFGQIRYMNSTGCKRKFDVGKYCNLWNND